jgi:hypothetical protein
MYFPSKKTNTCIMEKTFNHDIEITFINHSNDTNNSQIVIFQKNVATNFDEIAVAWLVLQNVGHNWSHKFIVPPQLYVGAQDSWGNVSDLQPAQFGQKWNVVRSTSGDVLSLDSTPATSPREIEVKNGLSVGSVDAQLYRNGKLLATKTGISPQQKAVFKFKPTIWIGLVNGINEGDIMNSAILSDINTELLLLGITRANLVMSGGGTGPVKFSLQPTA